MKSEEDDMPMLDDPASDPGVREPYGICSPDRQSPAMDIRAVNVEELVPIGYPARSDQQPAPSGSSRKALVGTPEHLAANPLRARIPT